MGQMWWMCREKIRVENVCTLGLTDNVAKWAKGKETKAQNGGEQFSKSRIEPTQYRNKGDMTYWLVSEFSDSR